MRFQKFWNMWVPNILRYLGWAKFKILFRNSGLQRKSKFRIPSSCEVSLSELRHHPKGTEQKNSDQAGIRTLIILPLDEDDLALFELSLVNTGIS